MFGQRVRALRLRAGLSQEDLAGRAGVGVRTIGSIEAGRAAPRPATLRVLADALGLDGADRVDFCALAAAEGADRPVPVVPAIVPAQMPADTAAFAGRVAELAWLDGLPKNSPDHSPAVVIAAVSGTAGVGKTALAVHWAHRVAGRFPDGQLYVDLRGFEPGGSVLDPADAVRGFLDALGVPSQRIPVDLDARTGLYRSLLAGRRMLVVLDNARDAEQVRPLLPGGSGVLVLVTSRNQLTSLITAGAHALTLDLLTPTEAHELLVQRLGRARMAVEPEAVDEIIRRCAQLPLALAIVAARGATHPTFPLRALADELRDARGRLDALAGQDASADVRAVFSWSYHTLSAEAARLFRLLGLHSGPDISAAAAASLAGLPLPRVRPALTELTGAHLIVEHVPDRFTSHDLLRAYANQLAHASDPAEHHTATRRMLDHYLHTAHSGALLLFPARDPISLARLEQGVTPENLTGHDQALGWFTKEHRVLLAVIDNAASAGLATHTWQLAWTVNTFLDRRGHWYDLAATQRLALAAARNVSDPSAQARAHRHLGRAYLRLGRYGDARTHYQHALDLQVRAGNQVAQADIHLNLALVFERQSRHDEALECARRALDLHRAAAHRSGETHALNVVGWYHALLGDYQQGITCCQQALTQFREMDHRPGQADTWDSLGYIHHGLGDHTRAVTAYRHALDLYQDLGDRYGYATSLTRLGDTQHAAGDMPAARQAWRHALTILDELDHPDAKQLRLKLNQLSPREHPATG